MMGALVNATDTKAMERVLVYTNNVAGVTCSTLWALLWGLTPWKKNGKKTESST